MKMITIDRNNWISRCVFFFFNDSSFIWRKRALDDLTGILLLHFDPSIDPLFRSLESAPNHGLLPQQNHRWISLALSLSGSLSLSLSLSFSSRSGSKSIPIKTQGTTQNDALSLSRRQFHVEPGPREQAVRFLAPLLLRRFLLYLIPSGFFRYFLIAVCFILPLLLYENITHTHTHEVF